MEAQFLLFQVQLFQGQLYIAPTLIRSYGTVIRIITFITSLAASFYQPAQLAHIHRTRLSSHTRDVELITKGRHSQTLVFYVFLN